MLAKTKLFLARRACTYKYVVYNCTLGAQAQALIKDIGRRTNLFVPPSLSHETSWATLSITTFLRSVLTFPVRKSAAVILCKHHNISEMTFSRLPPPIQTPLTESDQGNLVGNFLAY